jgi:hypothetical protein
MIFFSGFGFLVPVIGAIGFFLPIFLEMWIKSRFGIQPANSVTMTFVGILPFMGLLALDRLLRKLGPTQKAIDVNSGRTVEIAATHTFMFLPVRWCAYIWMGLVICITIATLVHER